MASYTGLSNLKNSVHKSGFDLSQKTVFSSKCGELLPIFQDIATPNTKYRINMQLFTRTEPVNTAAFTRLREYIDFYFVPLRLLHHNMYNMLTQMQEKELNIAKSFSDSSRYGEFIPNLSRQDIFNVLKYMYNNQSPGYTSVNSAYVDDVGFPLAHTSAKLFNHLGLNSLNDRVDYARRFGSAVQLVTEDAKAEAAFRVNDRQHTLYLQAYQKIYQDFFRWSQWENSDPTAYNMDWFSGVSVTELSDSIPPASSAYWKNPSLFKMRYCNWQKDLMMSLLPSSQFGDVAVVSGSSITTPDRYVPVVAGKTSNQVVASHLATEYSPYKPAQLQSVLSSLVSSDGSASLTSSGNPVLGGPASTSSSYTGAALYARVSASVQSNISVLALRQAIALQRWKEITQSGDTNYREQIRKHFGVTVPHTISNMATYIGGMVTSLDINEVVNTNLISDSAAYIKGKGVSSGTGYVEFDTGGEYGVIMGIYHCLPLLDYNLSSGASGDQSIVDVKSFPIPELDSLGMEAVPFLTFFNNRYIFPYESPEIDYLGYAPRYYAFKTKQDRILGKFLTVSKDYVAPVDSKFLRSHVLNSASVFRGVSYKFFKCSPSVLDSLFLTAADAYVETDPLLHNLYVECHAVKPFSRDGMPY